MLGFAKAIKDLEFDQYSLRTRGSAVIWVFFTLLLSAAAGVFFVLPRYVEENRAEDQIAGEDQFVSADRGELGKDKPEPELYKKQAKAYREQFLGIKSRLEAKGAFLRGNAEFEKILVQAKQADELLELRQDRKAADAYERVLAETEKFQALLSQGLSPVALSAEITLEKGSIDQHQKPFQSKLSTKANLSEEPKDRNEVNLDETISVLLQSGKYKEDEGKLNEALKDYKKAEQLDAGHHRTRQSRERVEQTLAEMAFNKEMSRGYSALKQNRYGEARKAFTAARNLKPQAVDVEEALKLTDAKYKSHQINTFKRQATAFEIEEKWREAENTYKAALDLDPYLEFAIEGAKRSRSLQQLNNEIDHLINHPGRLSFDETYYKAQQLLTKAKSREAKGPKLKMKITRAEKILVDARTAVPVTLESDGRTDVVVYKVGRLGHFDRRILNLYPGAYTAVGSCTGYQDIREEFSIIAGAAPEAIFIRCKEAL